MKRILTGAIIGLLLPAWIAWPAEIKHNEKAELPFWPYGVDLPESVLKHEKPPKRPHTSAPVMVWAPEAAERIRAVLLIVNNAASKHFGEHPALREVAARHEMGVVYLRRGSRNALDPEQTVLRDILAAVAETTGIP